MSLISAGSISLDSAFKVIFSTPFFNLKAVCTYGRENFESWGRKKRSLEKRAVDRGVENAMSLSRCPMRMHFSGVLGIMIRIRRIRMFLGLQNPDPDPLVRGTDPDQAPDPSLF
jgi:hypothetical protein